MAIGIPVPGLGSVSVLTRKEDLVRMTCRSTTALGLALKKYPMAFFSQQLVRRVGCLTTAAARNNFWCCF
ncbi:hypothetical protein JCM19046_654 [Bacillus sp. JCM 19046]|nr:hypothetical protein JCM19045_1087 [Bacillus sp. JCM 19045]GAF16239.1 hypothetical protein JCM19046_654 [Bacillus sp. JCM 19046]